MYRLASSTYGVVSTYAGELVQQVRLGFEAQRKAPDIEAVKFHLSAGRAQLKELTEMLDMMRA